MKNKYEIRGDVTAIFIDSPKYGRHETLISTTKLERAKEFPGSWYVNWNNDTKAFYVNGQITIGKSKQKTISLHRWITNSPKEMYVDHINHDVLDNVDSNLRIVTNGENQQNRLGAQRNSSSGIRGVHWHNASKKWQVQIKINKKKKTIGYYSDLKEAEKAAIDARKIYMPFSNAAF
ncbi:hypothetical protein D3P07_11445 [Paenibacillus sp. 1011MAR3C5]|uniref:HNH endonuclease n=1 Tax=Paenibacillus sp. 1011MAR3C5 TaxID=1675787 RepID=UPI000E6D46A5|nr:HNH endonuclease [Paenibacillus sp. 1011MAR3C5]RJE88602.1 hypothetical protein D3P07_11445 [Paenibacillus sp. 1011MAR3C5]